jgi:hypothetical protein
LTTDQIPAAQVPWDTDRCQQVCEFALRRIAFAVRTDLDERTCCESIEYGVAAGLFAFAPTRVEFVAQMVDLVHGVIVDGLSERIGLQHADVAMHSRLSERGRGALAMSIEIIADGVREDQ